MSVTSNEEILFIFLKKNYAAFAQELQEYFDFDTT